MCPEGGRNPDRRETLLACLYHICRIRVRQGCTAPKGQGLDAPLSLQIIINQARQSLILTVTGCERTQSLLQQLPFSKKSSVFWMGDSKVLGSRFCEGEVILRSKDVIR